ncbi:MAG: peptidoglycan editing factor PgeF [Cyanobacteria bacterium P01_F01_bin.153]
MTTPSFAESSKLIAPQRSRWTWTSWEGLDYLTCDLLSPWCHGFFTRDFLPTPPAELTPALAKNASVLRVKQVHGDRVLTPTEIANTAPAPESIYPPADGVLSENTNQAAWVCTADCTPVLIGDLTTGMVSAVHAGWRGTAQKIVPKAINRLINRGAQLETLRVALGPAISGAVYQVHQEVADQLVDTLSSSPEQWVGLTPVQPDSELGKARLDVRHVNLLQLLELGLASEQLAIAPHCTYSEPDKFFSYRRDGTKTVQWSGIVSKD